MPESALKSDRNTAPPLRPRLWPALLIAFLHFLVAQGFLRLGTTNIHNAIALGGIPGITFLLLLLWWLTTNRVTWRDRIAGALLVFAGIALIVFTEDTPSMGGMLLALALPWLIYGLACALAVTFPLGWSKQRWALTLLVVIWAAVFSLLRVDSIGGDLAPVTSWRWELSTAARSEGLPLLDTGGRATFPASLSEEDWPAFRGPARDGRAPNARFSTHWSATPPREVWRRPIGAGWSSFIYVGGYLFTQEQRGAYELISCYEADTGAPVWQNRVEATFDDAMGPGPRATPTYADGKLFTQGVTGIVQCLDAATGETLWSRDLRKDTNKDVPSFGFASSPLVMDDKALFFSGGGDGKNVIAFDVVDGEIVWSAGAGAQGYSSPHYAVLHERPQVLVVSDFGIQAFAPDTGDVLWNNAWDIKTNPRCVQPVVVDHARVMLGATGTSGTRLLHVEHKNDAWTAEEQWTTRQFRPYFNDGALHKGHYYGFDGERVACLEVETGKRLWSGDRYSGQMLLLPEMDMLLILSESGDVALVSATPERFHEHARFKALTGKTWNHPIIVGGKLYIRNAQEAACFELPGL